MEMQVPTHVKEEITDLIPNSDLNEFLEFSGAQFKELVAMGVFLKDVKFTELSLKARRKVIFSAFRLWIAAGKETKLV